MSTEWRERIHSAPCHQYSQYNSARCWRLGLLKTDTCFPTKKEEPTLIMLNRMEEWVSMLLIGMTERHREKHS